METLIDEVIEVGREFQTALVEGRKEERREEDEDEQKRNSTAFFFRRLESQR